MRSFLYDRRAYVTWGQRFSWVRIFKESLPHSSGLASLLQLIYMIDLDELLPKDVLVPAFADDFTYGAKGRNVREC